jgi:hypothetical protein
MQKVDKCSTDDGSSMLLLLLLLLMLGAPKTQLNS